MKFPWASVKCVELAGEIQSIVKAGCNMDQWNDAVMQQHVFCGEARMESYSAVT